MTAKLSYYDFLANFVPGAFLIGVALFAFREMVPPEFVSNVNAIVDTVLFGIWALVLGHGIQFRATRGLQERLRKTWGGWVSEAYLRPGSKYCSEARRTRYLEAAKKQDVLTPDAFAALETSDLIDRTAMQRAAQASHDIYRAFHTAIRDSGRGEKAEIANTQFGFYRGLAVACFYGAVLTALGAIIRIAVSWPAILVGLSDILLALLLFWLYFMFKQRVIERGTAHVREVFDSFLALNTKA